MAQENRDIRIAKAEKAAGLLPKPTQRPNVDLNVDQNKAPKNLLVNEPSLSTQGIGGSSGG